MRFLVTSWTGRLGIATKTIQVYAVVDVDVSVDGLTSLWTTHHTHGLVRSNRDAWLLMMDELSLPTPTASPLPVRQMTMSLLDPKFFDSMFEIKNGVGNGISDDSRTLTGAV